MEQVGDVIEHLPLLRLAPSGGDYVMNETSHGLDGRVTADRVVNNVGRGRVTEVNLRARRPTAHQMTASHIHRQLRVIAMC